MRSEWAVLHVGHDCFGEQLAFEHALALGALLFRIRYV